MNGKTTVYLLALGEGDEFFHATMMKMCYYAEDVVLIRWNNSILLSSVTTSVDLVGPHL